MNISITTELQSFIDQQLASGEFDSVDKLVNVALARFRQSMSSLFSADEDLKRQVALGVEELERGEAEEWDPEGLWDEVERRHAAESRPDGKKAG